MNALKSFLRGHAKEEKHKEKGKDKENKENEDHHGEIPASQPNHHLDNDTSHDETVEDRKKLWTKVSGLIGKDTTSLISLPVSLFEPISVLQSMCEPLRYADLLEKCCEQEDPLDRLCIVASFLVALFSNYVRTKKPFNPVLGETFEFAPSTKPYRTLCEQVSHHPPIGLVHTVSDEWTLQQESRIETKFWGNSVDIFGLGNNHLTLHKHGDHLTWKNPATLCHNIIFGRMWIEHHGTINLTNHTTGDTAQITYKKGGWFEGINYTITGEVHDKDKNLRAIINGKWNDHFSVTKVDTHGKKGEPVVLWKKPVDNEPNKWKWPKFLFELTALDDELESILPPSDSRLRSDLRALASLDMKAAAKEKNKIEDRQRLKRKERELNGVKWTPMYFKKLPDEKFEHKWEYVGNYWEEREQRIKERELSKLASRQEDNEGRQEDFHVKKHQEEQHTDHETTCVHVAASETSA